MSVCRRNLNDFNVDLDASVSPCVDDMMQINETSDVTSDVSMKVSVEDCPGESRIEFFARSEFGDESMKIILVEDGSPFVEVSAPGCYEEDDDDVEEKEEVDAAVCSIIPPAVVSDCESDVESQSVDVHISKGSLSYGFQDQVQYEKNNFRELRIKNRHLGIYRKAMRSKNAYIRQLLKKLVNRTLCKQDSTIKALKMKIRELEVDRKNEVNNVLSQMHKIIEENLEVHKNSNAVSQNNAELIKQNTRLNEQYFSLNDKFLQVTQNPRNTLVHLQIDPRDNSILRSRQVYVESECENGEKECFEGTCRHLVMKHVGRLGVNVKPPL